MPEYELEVSRHKPPRQDCVEAGFDYPQEGWGLVILAGEWSCPACEPRAKEKDLINLQDQMLVEQRRANDLKQEELYQREKAYWVDAPLPKPAYRQYTLPDKQPQQTGKGGMKVEPARD